jgi:hypothetical protein
MWVKKMSALKEIADDAKNLARLIAHRKNVRFGTLIMNLISLVFQLNTLISHLPKKGITRDLTAHLRRVMYHLYNYATFKRRSDVVEMFEHLHSIWEIANG